MAVKAQSGLRVMDPDSFINMLKGNMSLDHKIKQQKIYVMNIVKSFCSCIRFLQSGSRSMRRVSPSLRRPKESPEL